MIFRSLDENKVQFPSMSTSEKEFIFEQLQKLFLKATADVNHLEALMVEYLRFIYLKILRPGNTYQPCEEVDAMWHAHILCTKQYHEFCNRCNRGAYIHTPDRHTSFQTYRNTLKAYSKEFGSEPNPRFWSGIGEMSIDSKVIESSLVPEPANVNVNSSSSEHIIKIPDFHLTLEELRNSAEPTDTGCTLSEKVAMCQINAMQKLKIIFGISEIKYRDIDNGFCSYIGEQATSSPGCASNAIFFCKKCHHVWEFGFCNRDSACLRCRHHTIDSPVTSGGEVEDNIVTIDYIVRCFGCG